MRCNRADARRSLDANSDRRRFPPVRRYALERRNGHGAGQGCRLTDQTMVASSSAGRITAVIHGLSPSSALRRERGRGGSKCNGKSLITYTRTTGLPRVSQALYSQPVYVWSWWASKTAQETTPTGPEHARVQSVSQLPSAVNHSHCGAGGLGTRATKRENAKTFSRYVRNLFRKPTPFTVHRYMTRERAQLLQS